MKAEWGVVYLAEDTKLERMVAIKSLPQELLRMQMNGSDLRLRHELQRSKPPNIMTIHNIEEINERLFIVMEYVDGKGIEGEVGTHRDAPLQLEKVIIMPTQIAAGLQAAA